LDIEGIHIAPTNSKYNILVEVFNKTLAKFLNIAVEDSLFTGNVIWPL
jgi:hypothetical protein